MIQCSKMVNFNCTEAGLTSKWGRISSADQRYYQNQFICIIRRCTTPGDVTEKFVTHTETFVTHTKTDTDRHPWDTLRQEDTDRQPRDKTNYRAM